MTEPIDQATKDLIEKEAQVAADCEYDVDYPYEKYYVKGYIAGATVWAEQLKQKDLDNLKLRNDLADALEVKQGNGPTALSMLYNDLKLKEEVIRELTSSLTYIVKTLGALTLPQDEPEARAYNEALKAIEKAKSLTTKDKSHE
mgnify:CR=1 FL=1